MTDLDTLPPGAKPVHLLVPALARTTEAYVMALWAGWSADHAITRHIPEALRVDARMNVMHAKQDFFAALQVEFERQRRGAR